VSDQIFGGAKVVRRPITDAKEKDRIEHEQREHVERVIEEQRDAKKKALEDLQAVNEPMPAPGESQENWKPPETLEDFQRFVDERHPLWPLVQRRVEANLMFMRAPLVNKAFLDGLKIGRRLREQAEYHHGWWWDALAPLAPFERTYVVEQVKRVVLKDKPKSKRQH
jgi:hypothetical protein